MEESTFSLVLDAVYDAATGFERWSIALERLGQALGCSYVGLIERNQRTMEGRATAIGVDVASQREYFNVWTKHDILLQRTPVYRPGAVEIDQAILPRADLLRSDYYNAFMKPHDMHAYMRMTLTVENEVRKVISMSRPIGWEDYGTAEIEQCRRLMPHLRRAARVAQRVEESKLQLTAFSDVLEQSPTGVLLLSRTGKILFANRAARAMAQAADGFLLGRERIEVLNGQGDTTLQRLIAEATGRIDRTDATRGGVMRLARTSGKPDFAIAVAPLASGTNWAETGPVAFVLITDSDVTSTRPEAMIRQLFSLSATETRVAERLMMGDSPERAAEMLEIKMSTVRWHMASLYRKTGTSRQAQLLRLLLSLPMI